MQPVKFHVPTLAIIGVGLIGGSLSMGLKKVGAVKHVIGYGRSVDNLRLAKKLGVIDSIAASAGEAVRAADIVIIATPVGAMPQLFFEISPAITADKIISDVGSVKSGIVCAARDCLGAMLPRFVPAHPVAGKEHSGVSAASAALYKNHKVVITATAETSAQAVETIEKMWQAVGAGVVHLGVEEHDRVLSITSHLPHLLAYAMVDLFATSKDRDKCGQMIAGGFYDSTRLASSDPVMWRDICEMNRDAILQSIASYKQTLDAIVLLIKRRDQQGLQQLFEKAKSIRAMVAEK